MEWGNGQDSGLSEGEVVLNHLADVLERAGFAFVVTYPFSLRHGGVVADAGEIGAVDSCATSLQHPLLGET